MFFYYHTLTFKKNQWRNITSLACSLYFYQFHVPYLYNVQSSLVFLFSRIGNSSLIVLVLICCAIYSLNLRIGLVIVEDGVIFPEKTTLY